MAEKVSVHLVDDLDGSEAEETVLFGLDGAFFEIDLSGDNAAQLRHVFADYIEAGRKTGSKKQKRGGVSVRRSPEENQQIREWARKSGQYPDIGDRGRLPGPVVAAYYEAHKQNTKKR